MDKKIILALDFKNAPEALKTATQNYGNAEKAKTLAEQKLAAAQKNLTDATTKATEMEKAFNAELNAWTPATGV